MFQKLISRAIFHCAECDRDMSVKRSFFSIFNRYCECPHCGTPNVSRLASKDRIDRMSPNPFRRVLKLLGCPIYHCTFCRLQFRDWRQRQTMRPTVVPTRSA